MVRILLVPQAQLGNQKKMGRKTHEKLNHGFWLIAES
jgi:hypothetical protein